MFTHIRTSKENKVVIAQLTRKHGLGAENVIARIALAQSLEIDKKLDLKNIRNTGGKEYSRSVLFGEYEEVYIGMVCTLYEIHKTHRDIGKYIKSHLDSGLEILSKEESLSLPI